MPKPAPKFLPEKLLACSVETTLTLISKCWRVLIIWEFLNGKMRFGELKKAVEKISQKVSTQSLRAMGAVDPHGVSGGLFSGGV